MVTLCQTTTVLPSLRVTHIKGCCCCVESQQGEERGGLRMRVSEWRWDERKTGGEKLENVGENRERRGGGGGEGGHMIESFQ